jgi:hypothetical protein
MCLRRAPEKYIAGAALDRAELRHHGSCTFPGTILIWRSLPVSKPRTRHADEARDPHNMVEQNGKVTVGVSIEQRTAFAKGVQQSKIS